MTYQTINGWTKARMIERIMKRVPEDGCRNDYGRCVYRRDPNDPASATCAVGAFIRDEDYDFGMDQGAFCGDLTYGADGLAKHWPHIDGEMPIPTEGLQRMQAAHDGPGESTEGARQRVIEWIEENVEDA